MSASRNNWEDRTRDQNDSRADEADARLIQVEASAQSGFDAGSIRADDSDLRQDLSDTRADDSDIRQDKAEQRVDNILEQSQTMTEREAMAVAVAYKAHQRSKALVNKVALALSIIALGCAFGIYTVSHKASQRADKNICAVNKFVEIQKQRTLKIKLSGYRQALKDLNNLQKQLRPPLADCAKIIKG